MKLNITQLQYLRDLLYASDGYNDGDRIANELADIMVSEIQQQSRRTARD